MQLRSLILNRIDEDDHFYQWRNLKKKIYVRECLKMGLQGSLRLYTLHNDFAYPSSWKILRPRIRNTHLCTYLQYNYKKKIDTYIYLLFFFKKKEEFGVLFIFYMVSIFFK